MDIFCEQIVKKKKTTYEKLTVALIWVGGWFLCMGIVLLGLNFPSFFMLALLAAAGVVYGAFKLASRMNLEYEYSVTNGSLDIDKIINRSDRKRMVSVDVETFDRFEPFDAEKIDYDAKRYDKVVVAVADPMGEDPLYAAVLRHPAQGRMLIVFQPGEKVLEAVQRALPRNLQPRRFG